MKFPYYLTLVLLLFTSCIKDEPKNTECDILAAWVEDLNWKQHFSQATDMRINDVSSGTELLTFTVKQLSALPPLPIHFQLTPGATISPADGTPQDFTRGPVIYTVTSEDGQWHRSYTINFKEATLPGNKHDFEDFEIVQDKLGNDKYFVWYEKTEDGTKDYIWASGNEGYMIAKPAAPSTDYPTVYDENGYDGYCIRLTTRSTGSWGKTFKKPIAAGNFYLGSFNSQYALTNTLKTTNMGVPYTKEPVRITGYYKYTPGEVFTDKDFNEIPSRTDEPAIYAVLYLNHDKEGNEVMLHGDDVRTSSYIVREAEVASLPATGEWQPFAMTFEGTTPIDAELLANRGYNLALVFSSSKTGDTFEGAVGSTLHIDKVEIIFKNEE